MTDQTAISTQDAERMITFMGELKDTVKSARTEMAEFVSERDSKLDDIDDEVKRYGSEFADSKAKLEEMAVKMGETYGLLQPALDKIDEIQAKLDDPRYSGSDGDKMDVDTKEALQFYEQKHVINHAGDDRSSKFKAESISDEELKDYSVAKGAFQKLLRMKSNIPDGNAHLSHDEQKAISTFTYGSEMMLQAEMSNQILECWEEDTAFEGLLDQIAIGKEAIQYMVDYDVDEDPLTWNCEADCAPKPGTDPTEMGLRTYTTGEARVEHCVTNRMLEDSEIDIPSLLIDHVSRKFKKGERRAYMQGDGRQKPEGILNSTDNHAVFKSGVHSNAASGEFGWQDLVAMYWKFPTNFRSNSSWFFNEDALVKMFTLTDGDGNPIMGMNAFAQTGIPRLMGKEVRENTYMPDYVDSDENSATFGDPVVGSKPIALGNWKEGYLRVERKQFSVLRDPWSLVRCGVVWHFTRRFGGGIKCPNAMWFMEIQ